MRKAEPVKVLIYSLGLFAIFLFVLPFSFAFFEWIDLGNFIRLYETGYLKPVVKWITGQP